MSTLNNLLQQRQLAITMIQAAGGELTPEQELELVENEKQLIKKVDATVAVRKEMDVIAAHLKEQIEELKQALSAVENYAERFDERIKWVALQAGTTELVGDSHIITVKPTRGSVEITDDALAKELYGITETKVKIRLDDIRKDLDKGLQLGCAKIVQGSSIKTKVKK
jgi:chaperonin cofactor prefoldin